MKPLFTSKLLKCSCSKAWRGPQDQQWRCFRCDPPSKSEYPPYRELDLNATPGELSISAFSHAEASIKIYSRVLDEHVWFVPLAKDCQPFWDRGEVPYTAREMLILTFKNPSPDELRDIHAIKKAFQGQVCRRPM